MDLTNQHYIVFDYNGSGFWNSVKAVRRTEEEARKFKLDLENLWNINFPTSPCPKLGIFHYIDNPPLLKNKMVLFTRDNKTWEPFKGNEIQFNPERLTDEDPCTEVLIYQMADMGKMFQIFYPGDPELKESEDEYSSFIIRKEKAYAVLVDYASIEKMKTQADEILKKYKGTN